MILLAHTRGFGMVAIQGQPLVPFKITSIEMELTEAERLRSTQLVMAILLQLVTNMDDSKKQEMRGRTTEFLARVRVVGPLRSSIPRAERANITRPCAIHGVNCPVSS